MRYFILSLLFFSSLLAHSEGLKKVSCLCNNNKINFSHEEREYLSKKRVIKYCTQPDSLPYSAISNGKFIGIGAGVIDLASQISGIKFDLVPAKSWEESIRKAVTRECDILPLAEETASRKKYFNFSNVYYEEPLVIITNKEENYILDVKTVLDKDFLAVKGNSFVENLKAKYPTIKITLVSNINEAFKGLESGKYFGYIDIMMSSAYAMQKYSKINLKIAGQFDESVKVSFAVRNDDAQLLSIMNKIVSQISKEDIQLIVNKWISINYAKNSSFAYSKELAIGILLFVAFMLYREYFLKRKNLELKSLQTELVVLNNRLKTKAFEATADLEKAQSIAKIGSWILDINSETFTLSKETYALFDIPRRTQSEDIFKSFRKRIHPDDITNLEILYKTSVKNHSEFSVTHRLLMDDGTIKYIKGRAQTKYNDFGAAMVSYGTVQDVTESTLQELELKKKDKYLLHQSRLAQMGEMLSMIAHQWKQPLSAIASTEITIKATLELEKYDFDNKEERESFLLFLDERLDKIALYVKNLSKTISDFSNFYKPTKKSEHLSVDSVILRADELVKDSLKAKGIVTTFDLKADVAIDLYANEFMQVILNLITNAKDQLLDNKVIEPCIIIKSYRDENHIIIEVEDNAGGIDEKIMEQIFDPYFSTKLEKNGTGLGLYMCQMIINEYHNGKIFVKNGEKGALFRIELEIGELCN